MTDTTKAPSGKDVLKAVREELMLNLYPLPYCTLAPTVYHVYLHADDFSVIEGVVPRIVAQVQRALTADVEKVNQRLEQTGRRALDRLLQRPEFGPIEIPASGWEVYIQPDRNGELNQGQLGIVSTLSMPAPAEYGGTPTTRIVKTVSGRGRRTTTTEVQTAGAGAVSPDSVHDSSDRASLAYEDEQGPHVFIMRKDSVSVGRGGSAAWVDVQVITSSKVSREHVRIRRDASGRFFVQDVSAWGTSVDGEPLPAAVRTADGVVQPGEERPLPSSARIGLADAVVIQFQATAR